MTPIEEPVTLLPWGLAGFGCPGSRHLLGHGLEKACQDLPARASFCLFFLRAPAFSSMDGGYHIMK